MGHINWKVHLQVIGIITVVILAVYWVTRPAKQEAFTRTEYLSRYVQIESADWGVNCNEEYAVYLQRKKRGDIKPDPAQPEPQPVTANNVLAEVGKLCDIKETCTIPAQTAVLGDPYTACLKQLEVSWRCFSYDVLHRNTVPEGDDLTIDCRSEGAQPTPSEEGLE